MHKKSAAILFSVILALIIPSQLEGADVIKLGMLRFTSPPELLAEADTVTEIFSTILSASDKLRVIRRTPTDINDTDIQEVSSFGQAEGCSYMLIGSLTRDRDIVISVRIVETAAARVIFSTSAASQPKDGSSMRAESIKLADRVCEKLTGSFCYVSDVKGKDIYINRGSSSGVRKGDLYSVISEVSNVLDVGGNVTGMSRMYLAVIEVQSVNKTSSTARFFKNGGDERILSDKSDSISIKYGRLEAVSKYEARKLIRDNDFSLEALDDKLLELLLSSPVNAKNVNASLHGYQVPESELPELQNNAEMGYPNAQYRLGLYYMERNNFTLALKWYQEAAKEGNIQAFKDLGCMYEEGFGAAQDYTKAFEYYLSAAELGDAEAQASLGRMYRDGLGTKQDFRKAALWFEKSAAQGNARAKEMLDIMYRRD